MKTFYILYQVTNNLNGKIYVGAHKTKKLDDGYMGSGKVIKRAIEKHGIENFTKVILEQFDTSAAMYAREKEVVTDEFLLREDTYNLQRGGHGGFDYINKDPVLRNNTTTEGQSLGGKTCFERHSPKIIERLTLTTIRRWHENRDEMELYRQKAQQASQTKEVQQKKKRTMSLIKHQQKENNSQYGTRWITDSVSNRKIKKTDMIPEGWKLGRVSTK